MRKWSSAAELGGLVSRSLVREIKISPRPGWIRNDGTSPITLLEKISTLADENQDLRKELAQIELVQTDENLKQGDDDVEVFGERTLRNRSSYIQKTEIWNSLVTWDALFADLGPALINEASEDELKGILARFHGLDEIIGNNDVYGSAKIAPECWNEILIQFRALNYIESGIKKRGVNDSNRYWRITASGDKHLVGLLAKRR